MGGMRGLLFGNDEGSLVVYCYGSFVWSVGEWHNRLLMVLLLSVAGGYTIRNVRSGVFFVNIGVLSLRILAEKEERCDPGQR